MIALALIGKLDVVHQLFGRVLVPPAVWTEMTEGEGALEAAVIAGAAWIEVATPNESDVNFFLARLDQGEAEALALARLHRGCLVLIDEKKGRRVAREMGQLHAGTVHVLLRAKRAGFIAEIRPHLDALVATGFWVTPILLDSALREAGEL